MYASSPSFIASTGRKAPCAINDWSDCWLTCFSGGPSGELPALRQAPVASRARTANEDGYEALRLKDRDRAFGGPPTAPPSAMGRAP